MNGRRVIRCGGISARQAPGDDALSLDLHGPQPNVFLKITDVSEAMASNVPDILADLLDVAAYVFAADQAVKRGGSTDSGERWRRHFRFYIPVREPEIWSRDAVTSSLVEVLSFLSDDDYEFCFSALEHRPSIQLYFDGLRPDFDVDDVILFSGGLDSVSGAIHEIVGCKRRIALISHDSASKRKPQVDELAGELARLAPQGAVRHVSVWATKAETVGREYTQRTRSFLYTALAATVARMLSKDRIRFYENGVTSLNLPLAPQVVGGRATRTTHPQVILGFARFLSALLDLPFVVESPFLWKTKTDVVRLIREHGCGRLISRTVSCSRIIEATKVHTHCGRCSQCIDRRFAALAAGATDEEDPAEMYKVDLLTGERVVGETRAMAESFVRRAAELRSMPELEFLSTFSEVSRAVRHVGLPADEALTRIVDLHHRHAEDVHAALAEGLKRHAKAFQEGSLPDSCLLVLSVPQRYRQGGTTATHPVPTFGRDGQFWRVWFENEQASLKDSVGIRHISRLLAAPHQELHCRDLMALETGEPQVLPAMGSAGEAADTRTIRECAVRLKDLREEIEEAERENDLGRLGRLRPQEAQISAYLGSVAGKGGAPRPAADDAERARKAVLAAITRGIQTVSKHHPPLGRHLRKWLNTGLFCSYVPNPVVTWIVS